MMKKTYPITIRNTVLAPWLLALSGCLLPELQQLRHDHDEYVQRNNATIASLIGVREDHGNRLVLVEQSVRMLACGPELRSLFNNIEAACRATQNCSKSQLATPMASCGPCMLFIHPTMYHLSQRPT